METYRCAYRDPQSPLTPLRAVCDVTLRETLRDHSPSLVPIQKIVLGKCPTPKRQRSTLNKPSPLSHRPSPVKIVLSTENAASPETTSLAKSNYLQNLKRILTPNSRRTAKSIDLVPNTYNKSSRFTCFQRSPRASPIPMSPRVLSILQEVGQEKYSDIFRKEEIDLEVFKLLTKNDLKKLGVHDEKDIPVILQAIQLTKNW